MTHSRRFLLSRSRAASLLMLGSLPWLPVALAHAQTGTAASEQYSGVAHPPSDASIVANDDSPVAAPAAGKPMPGSPTAVSAPASALVSPAASQPANLAVAPVENADYGVVSSTASPSTAPTSDHSTHLVARPTDPDYGVVGMVPSPSNQLAEGTDIRVRLLQALSTTHSQGGEPFKAQVAADVYKEGRVVIPMGSELRGRVTEVKQGHRLGAHATIRLRPDAVILPDGTAYHLYAQAISTSAPGTRTDEEGGIETKTHVGKDLAEYGAGAGGGAIVGAALGGPAGAGAGAIVGVGVITTHLLLQKPAQARMDEGSEIVFSLSEPMDLLPTRN